MAMILASPKTPLLDPIIASQISSMTVLEGEEASAIIDSGVQALVRADNGALTYEELDKHLGSMQPQAGFSKSLRKFLVFSWDKLISIPAWIWGWFADKIRRTTTKSFYGPDSGLTVDAQKDTRAHHAYRDLMEAPQTIKSLQTQVLTALNQPPLPITKTVPPTLWTSLRAVVFSLVDGGSDNKELEPIQKDGRVAVVPDVGMVIPAPWDVWQVPTEVARHLTGDSDSITTVDWTDIAGARQLLAHLTERSWDLDSRLQEMDEKLTKSRLDLMTSERDYVKARELDEDFDVDLDETLETSGLLSGNEKEPVNE